MRDFAHQPFVMLLFLTTSPTVKHFAPQ